MRGRPVGNLAAMDHTPLGTEPPDPVLEPKPQPAPATASATGSTQALSFAGVADSYHRARPGYPAEAASWLVGAAPRRVLELGAGTGKLTAGLTALGHDVFATDPLAPMLHHLVRALPGVHVAVSSAEAIPLRARSVDVVVSAQAFHWFDQTRALPEIARVLRPGGRIALVWNARDERVPWVRRLGRIIGGESAPDPTHGLQASQRFGFVERRSFRFWQPVDRGRLRDLVRSRSQVAVLPEADRTRVLAEVDALYEEYGRGPDGLLLPYLAHCFIATVRAPALDPPTDDGDALLIDFA